MSIQRELEGQINPSIGTPEKDSSSPVGQHTIVLPGLSPGCLHELPVSLYYLQPKRFHQPPEFSELTTKSLQAGTLDPLPPSLLSIAL